MSRNTRPIIVGGCHRSTMKDCMVKILNSLSRWLETPQQGASTVPAVGKIRFGDMRRLQPFGADYGFGRGGAIDRYYAESFLQANAEAIRGYALEIQDDKYLRQFGGERVSRRDILDIDPGNTRATVIADLAKADHVPANTYDCIVLAQTLQFIYDLRSVMKHVHRILKPGGTLLLTVPGITRINYRAHGSSWYWSFTEAAVKNLLKEVFLENNMHIEVHGNVLVAASFLYGVGAGEITQEEYDYKDPDYPLVITAKAVKV